MTDIAPSVAAPHHHADHEEVAPPQRNARDAMLEAAAAEVRDWLAANPEARGGPEWLSRLAAGIEWNGKYRQTLGKIGKFFQRHF